ncbi:hypothetical protein Clacol_006344 [Clathrus columnatus]|uniref:Nucleoporin Nup133/Nup155-like C-terminal domain-containing protein n=1 Tax=Clathrus columnatus TaxID=1419009 RepID=A0AAV5AHD5_9AGAM|nr:hypothetical protein Clacol_006344 [Clathrus columnatus]
MLSNISPGRDSPQIHSRTTGFFNGNRGHSPRFVTPTLRRPGGSERSESPSKFMDVDTIYGHERTKQSEEARVFAASNTLTVRLAVFLPREVQQVFNASDPSRDIFAGTVDVLQDKTSYGIVLSVQTCFVWKIDMQTTSHSPTCYIFPVPPADPSLPYPTVPYASFVPFGPSREPGLILVSGSGELRFWDSIGIGLAGAERFSSTKVDLIENDFVTGLERLETTIFILKTTSKLYRLSLTSRPGTGKYIIVATPFSDPDNQPSFWLNPFKTLSKKGHAWDVGSIIAVRQNPCDQSIEKSRGNDGRRTGERLIWVLTDKELMLWNVNLAGGEQCIRTHKVMDMVEDALSRGSESNRRILDVEFLDVAVDSSGDPILLVSHTPLASSSSNITSGPLRMYAIIRLHQSSTSGAMTIKNSIEDLPYELVSRRTPDPRHGHVAVPRFAILETTQEGSSGLTFSQFSDAFSFSSLEPPYQEQIYLKKIEDVILGFGVLQQGDYHDVLILTKSMVLVARPNPFNIAKMRDDVDGGRITVLKSTIRQATKHGIKPDDDRQLIHFKDPDVVASSLSLGAQLSGRENSLKALISFIGDSGALSKLSPTTRENLLTDAEKLVAARGIWLCHNEQVLRAGSVSLLPSAIETYMAKKNLAEGDFLRTFFLIEAPYIEKLVPEIITTAQFELANRHAKNPQLLLQASGLVDALFTSAFTYRSQYRPKYQLNKVMTQPWTSEPELLYSLRRLFEATSTYVETSSAQKSESSNSEEFLLLLQKLASHLFRIFDDKLQYLNLHSEENNSVERERNRLEEEFRSLRPLGRLDFCFQLAEHYRDFYALSELSYRTPVGLTAGRIQNYTDKYKDDFTSQLYRWYIEQGKLQLLFNQDSKNNKYLDDFLEKNPAPRLSWVHDFKNKRYQEAASALLSAARDDTDRETKHLVLSIGKLATMANGPAATPHNKLLAFDTALDFVAIHDSLLQQFMDQGYSTELAVDTRVKRLTATKCSIPSDRAALQGAILQQLLQGKALSEEDAVDLLSMKDNTQYSSNFVDALNIISHSSYMTEERKQFCSRSVWRRIYLHDNWKYIRTVANQTDHELAASLRRTQIYQVLKSPAISTARKVQPSEAITIPTTEDLTSRHPGLASTQIQELIRDYERECKLLFEDGPSDSEFLHVQQLAQDDTSRNA